MYNTQEYQSLISVAQTYRAIREAEDPQDKIDAEKQARLAKRKPIKGKLSKALDDVRGSNKSAAADQIIKDLQGEDKKKAEAEARREKLKNKFGGRQGRIARKPGQDMAADDYIAMAGNKRAAKRMVNRGKIEDAKQEGEQNKKKDEKNEGVDLPGKQLDERMSGSEMDSMYQKQKGKHVQNRMADGYERNKEAIKNKRKGTTFKPQKKESGGRDDQEYIDHMGYYKHRARRDPNRSMKKMQEPLKKAMNTSKRGEVSSNARTAAAYI